MVTQNDVVTRIANEYKQALILAKESGYDRSGSRSYARQVVMEDYPSVLGNSKNTLFTPAWLACGRVTLEVFPSERAYTKHTKIKRAARAARKQQPKEPAPIQPTLPMGKINFAALYRHIADMTGRLPDVKIGSALALFFGYTTETHSTTIVDMKRSGKYNIEKNSHGYEVSVLHNPDDDISKLRSQINDLLSKLDEISKKGAQ